MDMTASNPEAATAAAKVPPKSPCSAPNTVQVQLTNFNPTKSVVIADLKTLLANVNVGDSTPKPDGCMSGKDDPDCVKLFPDGFGLSLDGKTSQAQHLFRIE